MRGAEVYPCKCIPSLPFALSLSEGTIEGLGKGPWSVKIFDRVTPSGGTGSTLTGGAALTLVAGDTPTKQYNHTRPMASTACLFHATLYHPLVWVSMASAPGHSCCPFATAQFSQLTGRLCCPLLVARSPPVFECWPTWPAYGRVYQQGECKQLSVHVCVCWHSCVCVCVCVCKSVHDVTLLAPMMSVLCISNHTDISSYQQICSNSQSYLSKPIPLSLSPSLSLYHINIFSCATGGSFFLHLL